MSLAWIIPTLISCINTRATGTASYVDTTTDTDNNNMPNDYEPELEAGSDAYSDEYEAGDSESIPVYTGSSRCNSGIHILLRASDLDVEKHDAPEPEIRGFVDQDTLNGYLVDTQENGVAYPHSTNHDVTEVRDDYFEPSPEQDYQTAFYFSFEDHGLSCDPCDWVPGQMAGVRLYFDATDGEHTTDPLQLDISLNITECE